MRGWYGLTWVVFGLCPGVVSVLRDSSTPGYGSALILAVMGIGYGLVIVLGERPAVRLGHLVLLVPALGAMALLPGGGAALFVLTVPQFWLLTRSRWAAIGLSAAAAVAVAAGALAPTEHALPGNAVVAAGAFAVSVPIGVWWHQREQRTRALDEELARTQQELAEAHRREGAAQERDRLAREIHDTLAQGFASIVALAEAARISGEGEQRARHLDSIEANARENLAEARVLVGSEPSAEGGSLGQSLQHALDRFAADTGVVVDADLADVHHGAPVRSALLRCAQESLSNVRKHASASTVTVVLSESPGGVELEITDDGRGFQVGDARGFGIDGMRRRLAELGGELTVTSSVGDGTRILTEIPVGGL